MLIIYLIVCYLGQIYSEVSHTSSHLHEHHSAHLQSHGPPIQNRTFAGTTEGCGYWTPYFTTPNIKFNMCTGQTQQDLKNGMSIINLINARGFLPTCRVMHLMLWMMSEATPHHYIQRDNYFIDVGANIGSCSVHMASLGLPVISVEPVVQHVQTIQGSADINPAFRIDVQHIGMASAQRTIKANFGHGARNWGATEFHEVGENQTFETELKLKTLDQVVGNKKVALLKVDCEGCEWAALTGAPRTLKRTHMIKIEVVQSYWTDHNESVKIYPKDILLLLEQSGFDLYTDLWAENELYFGNKGKQVLDIDMLFGSDKFSLKPSLTHLAESAARVLRAPIIAADFNHKEFLRTATDVIAIEKSLSTRMKAKWLGTAPV